MQTNSILYDFLGTPQEKIQEMMESDAGSRFAPVLEGLYHEVHKTKQTVNEYVYQLKRRLTRKKSGNIAIIGGDYQENLKKRAKELHLKFRYGRTIFHPSETHVNIFFLIAVSLKWIFFVLSFLWCTTISFSSEDAFLYIFVAMQILSTLITIVEIVFHFHVGYVDPGSGRIVMEPYRVYRYYLKSQTKFSVDVISLIPIWIATLLSSSLTDDTGGDKMDFLLNLCYRLKRVLPLSTIIMQLARSMELFRQPLQAQAFNSSVVSFKYFIKV